MKKRSRRPKKLVFIQDWGSYSNETVVAVGATHKDVMDFVAKLRLEKGIIKWLEDLKDITEKIEDKAYTVSRDGRTLLWMPAYEDCWEYWETLIHEINHLIDFVLVERKRMSPETEAKSYQFEYLFRSIRRKLQGTDPTVTCKGWCAKKR